MRLLIFCLLALLLTACGSVTVDTGAVPDVSTSYDEYYDIWGFGFAGEGRADVEHACPQDQVARIRNYFSVEDILLFGLFLGIYSPRTTTITCAKETAHASSAD